MQAPPKFINKLYNHLINDNFSGFCTYYWLQKNIFKRYKKLTYYQDMLISTAFQYPLKDKKTDLDKYVYFLLNENLSIQLVVYFMATGKYETAWEYFKKLTNDLTNISADNEKIMLQAIVNTKNTYIFQKCIEHEVLQLNDSLTVALKIGIENPEELFKNINFSEDNKLFILALLCQEKNESFDNKVDYKKYYKILSSSMNSFLEEGLIDYCQNTLSAPSISKLFSIVRAMGRDDDLLIINYMTSYMTNYQDIPWTDYIYSPYRDILPILPTHIKQANKIMFNMKLKEELLENNFKTKVNKL